MASAYIHEVPDQELQSDGVHLKVYNIFDGSTGQKEGMLEVKKYLEDNSDAEAIVIAAGGDGTVMWIISELLATGCCIERICVGVIPFGTGNDFSRSIGWGKKPPPRLVRFVFICTLLFVLEARSAKANPAPTKPIHQ